MRGASLKPNHRRVARAASRVVLNLVTSAAALTAAVIVGVWIFHSPEQVNASGDTLIAYSIVGAILVLLAVDSILSTLFQPLWDRLEDDSDLADDVLGYLADQQAHALDISRSLGTTAGTLFPVLAELEEAGEITSYWTEPSEPSQLRRRLYTLGTQA